MAVCRILKDYIALCNHILFETDNLPYEYTHMSRQSGQCVSQLKTPEVAITWRAVLQSAVSTLTNRPCNNMTGATSQQSAHSQAEHAITWRALLQSAVSTLTSRACNNMTGATTVSSQHTHKQIIYHDFLPTPRRGSHVKSGKTHTQSSRCTP